ncbi:D-ribose pyranase [Kroppenstedtia eburnea]|uniref:D-ribose pyranase n=1 Tax=Kroppenstedtia eburnea TaxID=714067 RepID=A0A1N7LAA0_9BACL|nr:D-ribose pyranase [Kroppenstedtia eburnea]EGK07416.1 ribose ABC superfamily ATP binding cassette transporter, membrane protein [Desmospora sp. 8437]QKI81448.1 D-ribose pyranase [Kroppenstedtia eburnea]SIS70776.1 D-ribose pyranase [Kroppenstedtia eburnea]
MKKTMLLNSHLSRVISELGHTDHIVIADAGLPIPSETERIDLALRPGTPGFGETLEVILSEMMVEKAILAKETAEVSPSLHQELMRKLPEVSWETISHEELKALTGKAKAVVRTGECTPYANVILQAGVPF